MGQSEATVAGLLSESVVMAAVVAASATENIDEAVDSAEVMAAAADVAALDAKLGQMAAVTSRVSVVIVSHFIS